MIWPCTFIQACFCKSQLPNHNLQHLHKNGFFWRQLNLTPVHKSLSVEPYPTWALSLPPNQLHRRQDVTPSITSTGLMHAFPSGHLQLFESGSTLIILAVLEWAGLPLWVGLEAAAIAEAQQAGRGHLVSRGLICHYFELLKVKWRKSVKKQYLLWWRRTLVNGGGYSAGRPQKHWYFNRKVGALGSYNNN